MSTIRQPQVEPSRPAPLREPLTVDEPKTLVEVYEGAVRFHPKPDTLNYKSDGAWRPVSADEMLRRARWIALGLVFAGDTQGRSGGAAF